MDLTTQEQQWIETQRQAQRRVYVGIDHHSAQITVSAACGLTLLQRPDPANLPIRRFGQDGFGYRQLLVHLAEQFPGRDPGDFTFVSEPTFAQPLGHFLLTSGYLAEQVLWVKTQKVAQYRKAHDFSRAGKNDDEDARTLLLMGFYGRTDPSSRLQLSPVTPKTPRHETLRQLAGEYHRLTDHSVQLQNKIFYLVVQSFPEIRHVFQRRQTRAKPDGTVYTESRLDLFTTLTPMALLALFPLPRLIHEAGFEKVWAHVGKSGVRKATIRLLVELAATSAGVPDELVAQRLVLLIVEYRELQGRLQCYREQMGSLLQADPVLASFLQIPCLTPVMLATLIGEIGNLDRFSTVDELKSYLGLAPKPMPQTGTVDAQGRLVQGWRMPANTYKVVNGQRRLVYKVPGKKLPRQITWLWFELLLRSSTKAPTTPFVQIYLHYKAKLKGQRRWLGRVRWKVIGKLLKTIYACLKLQQPYDPSQVLAPVA